jgi:hypothetical protein
VWSRALGRMAASDQVTKALLVKGSAGNPMSNPLVKIARNATNDMVRVCRRVRTNAGGAVAVVGGGPSQRAVEI